MLRALTIEGHTPCRALPWLDESWRDGPSFFRALSAGHANSLPARSKSVVLERYDLTFDLIGRNVLGDRAALRWQDPQDGWQILSFAELDLLSSRRAAEWSNHGVEAGKTLCLILPFGPEWVIAFLAAIRLGCVVSFLPPAGPRFHARRLAALAPDHIFTTPHHAPSLGDARAKVIPHDLRPAGRREESFVHATGAVFARLFSPLAPLPHQPIALTIDEAYCFALRDGLLAHGLSPGDAFAAPGVDPLQYQPSLLLATFLAGGTYVHVELAAVAEDPAAFAALDLATVGVMPRVRDLLLDAPVQLGKRWGHWWRGVNEESDYLRWQRFMGEKGLQSVPSSNQLVDSASGGAVFFSARRYQKWPATSYFLLPAAGVRWSLAPLGSTKPPAPTEDVRSGPALGLLAPHSLLTGKPGPGTHMLHRQQNEWFYAGVPRATRDGRTYPSSEVVDCLAGLPFLEAATVAPVATSDLARPYAFTLLVFVGRARTAELARERDAWRRAIEATIAGGLQPELAPDRVEFFPFSPRRGDKDALDEAWCRDRFARGMLHERITRDVYTLLDDLRALVTSPADAGATS